MELGRTKEKINNKNKQTGYFSYKNKEEKKLTNDDPLLHNGPYAIFFLWALGKRFIFLWRPTAFWFFYAQILRNVSQEPVHNALPSSDTPRQLTRFSCPTNWLANEPNWVSHT